MSAGLTLFSVMMAIILPVCLLMFISEYFKYKRSTNAQLGALNKAQNENPTEEVEKEIAELRERIVVLESIVTDRSYNLERKISNL